MRLSADSERKGSAGFTLLEVIVVLVITSLVTTILMQGLSIVLGTKLRFSSVLSGIEERGLQQSIITSPLRGLIPDYDDGDSRFDGDDRRIRGLTLYPLQGISGAPTSFTLSIDYNSAEDATEITYLEQGYDALTLVQWPGGIGEFSYRGREGQWFSNWPPVGDDFLQAPRTIRIQTGLEQSNLFVHVMGPETRPFRAQDSPLGPTQ